MSRHERAHDRNLLALIAVLSLVGFTWGLSEFVRSV
jgi:hypothetical protein